MKALIPLVHQPKIITEVLPYGEGTIVRFSIDHMERFINLREGDMWNEHEIVKFLGIELNEDKEWCLAAEVI